jgi:hypothetical protein
VCNIPAQHDAAYLFETSKPFRVFGAENKKGQFQKKSHPIACGANQVCLPLPVLMYWAGSEFMLTIMRRPEVNTPSVPMYKSCAYP